MSSQKFRILSLALVTLISSAQEDVPEAEVPVDVPQTELINDPTSPDDVPGVIEDPIDFILEPENNLIGTNCIKKHELRGNENVEGSTHFSDQDYVGKNIDKDMQLYAYYECNNKSKDLKSFQLVLANKDNEKKTLLAEVGPSSAVFIEEVLEVEEEVVDENSDDTFPEDGARNL